jgi:two-component system chemotaxis sensor kinase CheA
MHDLAAAAAPGRAHLDAAAPTQAPSSEPIAPEQAIDDAGADFAKPLRPAAPKPEAPILSPTVRVRTETLDRFLGSVGEVILSSSQLRNAAGASEKNAQLSSGLDQVERRVNELQRRVLDLRTTPLTRATDQLPRTARQIAERLGKRVEVTIVGAELELDRSILDRLSEPLLHMLRNAVDHGIELPEARAAAGKPEIGHIVIEARRQKDDILIELRDDGGGIDLDGVKRRAIDAGHLHPDLADDLPPEEIAQLVFRPGLSTAHQISDVSGRGVGMDAVKATIESLGGHVELKTKMGVGTTTTLQVPITAAVQRVLVVGIARERVALPINRVERILEVEAASLEDAGGECFTLIDEDPVLVLDLGAQLSIAPDRRDGMAAVPLVLTTLRGERCALRVDRFVGQQEIYVKSVPALLSRLRLLAGLTVLDDGCPVFVIDLNHLA